jgi:hypothetical protein
MTNEEFFKSLDEAGFDEAEAIEAEACKIFQEGWSKEVAAKFVRTVMELRRGPCPETNVESAIESTLKYGLSVIRHTAGLDGCKPKTTKRKSRLSGAGM